MKKYDLSKLFRKAWAIYRTAMKKGSTTFGESLKKAWAWLKVQDTNKAIVEAAAQAAGIVEEYHTWYGWTMLGREVIHESKAVFQVVVDTPEKGIGKTFKKSFFTISQTQPTPIS